LARFSVRARNDVPPWRVESRAALSLALALSLAPAQQALPQTMPGQAPPPLSTSDGRSARSLDDGSLATDQLRSGLPSGDPRYGSANYGAPRPKTRLPKPYPPIRIHSGSPRLTKNPLPPLEPYKTSAVARRAARLRPQRVGEPRPIVSQTVAVPQTIKTKPKPKVELNPYDPVGIGVGSLRLTPFVETSTGYDSNPDRLSSTSNPTGSKFFRADGGLKLRSDWERDDFQADMRLGYVDYFDYQQANRPDGVGSFIGRIDVTRDTAIDVTGHFNLDTQRPGAPAISSGLPNVTVINRPIIFSVGTSAGVTEKLNRLEVSLRGSFDRTMYQDAYYNDGSTFNLASTDFNDYGATGRVAYEISPSLKPFVEATVDTRVHDAYLDPYGYARDSNGLAARGGAAIKITDLLRGEASGGYAERDYKDPRLPQLRGPTIDASLIYTPTPLTTVTLRGSTTLNETTVAGAAGALTHTISGQISHDLLRNLTISALGSYFTNNYQGATLFEQGYTAGVKLEYKITRSVTVKASYSRERLTSNAVGDDYTANVFLVGLRIQE
jgi:hypothetical protein